MAVPVKVFATEGISNVIFAVIVIAVITCIISMIGVKIGHIFGLDVISEGVESQEQLDVLKDIGCDLIQGFIWGKPLTQDEAEKLLTDSGL